VSEPFDRPSCTDVVRSVRITYTIRSKPTPRGHELRVAMTLDNRLDWYFGGITVGGFNVAGDPRARHDPPTASWGGSSADTFSARPMTKRTRRLLTGVSLRGRPEADEITEFGAWADVFIAKTPKPSSDLGPVCNMPTHVRAPQGLVAGHPDGTWHLSAGQARRAVRQLHR
jgi:hypothetical protein